MEDVMDIIFTTHKGKHLVERYHVGKYKKLKRACKLMIKVPLPKTKYCA